MKSPLNAAIVFPLLKLSRTMIESESMTSLLEFPYALTN